MNSHQQQLLQLLQIKKIRLHPDFSHFQPETPQAASTSPSEKQHTSQLISEFGRTSSPLDEPEQDPLAADQAIELSLEHQFFAADIERALTMLTPAIHWSCKDTNHTLALVEDVLYTPSLSALSNPQLKQQLWQLLALWQNQHDSN
ncbi:MAG: hypothetical protein KKB45_15835 [Gammaproteobacteria bacterium]|nr:hypothetical protein [Gammaproteobacteria bacterium]